MEKLRRLKPVILFHLVLNSLIVIFITGASYYHVPLEGFKDRAIYFLHLCALQSTVAGFLYFLSLSTRLFRIVFTILFLAYCCFSFWAYSQDISITPALIQSVFETKPDIAADLITLPYLLFLLAAIGALVFIFRYHRRIEHRYGFNFFVIPALLCIAMFYGFEEKQRGIFKFRLPYNVVEAVKEYSEQPTLVLNTRVPPIRTVEDSIKLVLVLGETVRADHLGINGYERNTTPQLNSRGDIISFKRLCTDNTYTGSSVPQILTDEFLDDEYRPFTSLYTVTRNAGYRNTWIGNQTLEKSFEPIVNTNHDIILVDKYKSVFSFDKELDEVMLPPMDSLLTVYDRQLITIHMIGSHWWYENRYTDEFRKYTPVIDSKYIPSLTKEQMVNSYDNTILYLDNFLNEIIGRLEAEETPAVMIYISDHGELLGEGGKWLHAQKKEELMNPAYLLWFSESYQGKYPERIQSLRSKIESDITTDSFFPDVLEILNIRFED